MGDEVPLHLISAPEPHMKRRYIRRACVGILALVIALPSGQALASSDEDLGKSLKLLQQQLTDLQVQIRAIQDHLGVEPVQHAEVPTADAEPENKVAVPPGEAAEVAEAPKLG